jgi:hypothetical protein
VPNSARIHERIVRAPIRRLDMLPPYPALRLFAQVRRAIPMDRCAWHDGLELLRAALSRVASTPHRVRSRPRFSVWAESNRVESQLFSRLKLPLTLVAD